MTGSSHEWNSQDWLSDASKLIDWSHSVEPDSPLMVLIRHSHRVSIRTLEEMSQTGITELGRNMARDFGRRLPSNRRVEILHSRIPRCKQTAAAIAEGITQNGGEVMRLERHDLLLGPVVNDVQLWENVGDDGIAVADFVNSWADGDYGERIETFDDFAQRVADGTLNRITEADPDTMHIYVTHDLFLMGARKVYLQEVACLEQRPPYMGGLGLSIEEGKPSVFEGRTGRRFTINRETG